MSMRIRLVLSFLVVVSVGIFSVVLIGRYGTEQQVRAYMFRGGMTNSEGIVATLESFYAQNQSWKGVEAVLAGARMGGGAGMGGRMGGAGMSSQRLRLADPSGSILYDSSNDAAARSLTPAELKTAIGLHDERSSLVGYLLVDGGTGFLSGDETPLITRLNEAAFRAGLIAMGLALLVALLLAETILRPVRRLTAAVQKLASGDKTQQVPARGRDELAVLGRTFNQMTESLRSSENQRKAMTADIAHELRTPLAVQRATLEALQDGIYPLTAESLQPVLDQNLLLARLVDDLRTLALADSGELHLRMQPVNLEDLLNGLLEQFRPSAQVRGVEIGLQSADLAGPVSVLGDPDRLAQVLNNLLGNALRYTPEGGKISMTLAAAGGKAQIDVHDTGPGIPPESLPKIFDRFYRADPTHSRKEGGSGLGLAIARQLALAHGGELSAANLPQGGACFTLVLPLLP